MRGKRKRIRITLDDIANLFVNSHKVIYLLKRFYKVIYDEKDNKKVIAEFIVIGEDKYTLSEVYKVLKKRSVIRKQGGGQTKHKLSPYLLKDFWEGRIGLSDI
jgi:hypothetical protein